MPLIDLSLLILWLAVPWLWFSVLRIGGMSILKLSIPTFVVISIFLFQYLGFPILYKQWDDYRAEFVTDMDILMLAWVGTSVSTLLLCLGATIASKILKKRRRQIERWTLVDELPAYVVRRVYLMSAICIGILFLYVNKIGLQNLAITAVINQGTQADVTLARSMMGNAFDGGYHWYNFFMRHALIFLILVLFANRSVNKNSVSMSILILMTCCAGFSLVMATEKGLLVDFVISLFLMNVCIKYNGVVPIKEVSILGLGVVGILSIFYIMFMGDADLYKALSSIVSRGFTGSMQPIYHYIEYFPKYKDWLYGSSMPNPGGIFPFSPFDLTVNLMNFVQPEHYETRVIGTMPAIYWGEIYANFGWPGVLFTPIFIGIGLCLVNSLFWKIRRTPMSLALFVWLLMHYKDLSVTGLSTFIFDLNLYLIITLYALIILPVVAGDHVPRFGQPKV